MRRLARGILIGWLLIFGWFCLAGAGDEGPFLESPRGPYRGRVIDFETKQPLAGAVVVAVWWEGSASTGTIHAVREVLTDATGAFLLVAQDVEQHPPPETLRPMFLIFSPGYGAYPLYHAMPSPDRPREGFFEGAGGTIELPPLKKWEERGAHIITILISGPFKWLFRELGETRVQRELPHLLGGLTTETEIGRQLWERVQELERGGAGPGGPGGSP
jgi:hypothetical protein